MKLKDDYLVSMNNFSYQNFEYITIITKNGTGKRVRLQEFDISKNYKAGDKIYCINRNKSAVFAVIGKSGAKNGFNLVVSHIDSPRLDLKTNPLYEDKEMAWLKTHYYGGIKKYQWTAIPLSLHGKMILKDQKRPDGRKSLAFMFLIYYLILLVNKCLNQCQRPSKAKILIF